MISTARNRNSLSKRVRRFLEREQAKDENLKKLLHSMKSLDSTYLFGGILRDIALYGIAQFGSDIDIVYTSKRTQAALAAIGDFPMERNRFGGLRIKTKRWFVDLWEAEKSWAFIQGYREYKSIESLLDTTITNWESILYRVDGGQLICKDEYFHDLCQRYLDVVLDENPNTLGMYIRLVRAYAIKDASILSNKAAQVIREGLWAHSFEEMSDYEKAHFSGAYISKETYNYLKSHDDIRDPRKSFVNLKSMQGALPFDATSMGPTI